MDLNRFLLLVLLVLSPSLAAGATENSAPVEVSGVLTGTLHWQGEIHLVGDVLIPAGSHLTIASGTTVRVTPAEATRIDPEFLSSGTELLVRGSLEVLGTATDPVRFLADGKGDADDNYAWAGILLDQAFGSSVEGAIIEGAETGLLVIGCSPRIEGNRISGSRYGIIVQAGGAPNILDNTVENGEGGIFCWDGARPYLKGNRIRGQAEEGIYVDRWSRPWLDRNEVTSNDLGLVLGPRDLPADTTAITGNRVDRMFLGGRP
ncbi:hypothetical protein JCM30471_09260 [Desulfuromonas carbonis]|uniref:NosD domain-containing protein n=1 Tax=Desulfuromonas sp. DDH964 TaxID=1823759 RepID=UPI00078EC0C6|nr:right-handed parallel beta-helix repeat-containing protein [Desulfuromonas sp. DDH964]AMV72409.1 hypothetical protein DBW_2066 [Desulfuromonas sp. DDH964]